jgi:hypothetical protein
VVILGPIFPYNLSESMCSVVTTLYMYHSFMLGQLQVQRTRLNSVIALYLLVINVCMFRITLSETFILIWKLWRSDLSISVAIKY